MSPINKYTKKLIFIDYDTVGLYIIIQCLTRIDFCPLVIFPQPSDVRFEIIVQKIAISRSGGLPSVPVPVADLCGLCRRSYPNTTNAIPFVHQ